VLLVPIHVSSSVSVNFALIQRPIVFLVPSSCTRLKLFYPYNLSFLLMGPSLPFLCHFHPAYIPSCLSIFYPARRITCPLQQCHTRPLCVLDTCTKHWAQLCADRSPYPPPPRPPYPTLQSHQLWAALGRPGLR
jgi:hypothetical protein